MIFNITESLITQQIMFVETKASQAEELADLMESCGFTNFQVTCAGGYCNAISFDSLLQPTH